VVVGWLKPNSEIEEFDLTQTTDLQEAMSILACINQYALEIFATPIGQHLAPIDLFIPMRLATRFTRAAFGTLTCSSISQVSSLSSSEFGLKPSKD
jgi:hypothetical protein